MSARQKKDPIDFSAVAPPADQVALSRTRQGFAPARMMAQEKQSLQDRVIELEQQIAQVREEATATRQEAEANAAQLREAEAELARLKSVAEVVQNRGEGGSELLLLDP